ncbi:MAG: hypothetical protein KatS3mg022_3275 [Armatimonadota bacterium]|nr:MAG: hypothetical protein KatS3mg022_3275 [Armatimonadota bacterium]
MTHGTGPNRLTWATIVFAFIGSVVMYGVLVYLIQRGDERTVSPGLESMRLPVTLLGIACLIAAVVWAQLRLSVHGEHATTTGKLTSPQQFTTHTVIALAFAEACAVFGLLLFFLGSSRADFLMFAVPSVAVMVFFVLPKGDAYWKVQESRREE